MYRAIAKQQVKSEQTLPACLFAVEKYKNMESVTTQNDYETTSKN